MQCTCTSAHDNVRFLEQSTPAFFLQIYCWQIPPTLIRSITRYGVTSNRECISRSCTPLMKWRNVCWMLGAAWTRVPFTMQLKDGVSFLQCVYGQKVDILSNCCTAGNSIVCQPVWQDICHFMKHNIFISRKFELQISTSSAETLLVWWEFIVGFVHNLLLFPTVKEFWNPDVCICSVHSLTLNLSKN